VVSNPEFLKQGAAIEDFMKPDRVVIGVEANDERAAMLMKELYGPFTRTGAPILTMSTESAELCKYAANSILATRISFMNEIANMCELVGADVDQVRKAIGADRRIGTSFLFPGVGYGGSCFPKDTQALLKSAADKGYDFKILRAVEDVNDRQKGRLVEKIAGRFKDLTGKTIALWGLAFKPRTDDMREAPAIPIIEGLLARGAKVKAYDPAAGPVARRIFGSRIELCDKSYDALAAPTRWPSSRNGTNSASPISRGCAACSRRRSSSTAGTSIRPSRCARSASPICPLDASARRRARRSWPRRPRHGRRRLHRQPRGEGAQAIGLPRHRLRQPRRRDIGPP
jgi:UDPglucose 6-dehydrogenase